MSYTGILPIYKPAGMTSHDVVFKVRKILKMKKIGHTGTLDPEVDGVLVLCLGQATKLVEYIMNGEKVYQGEVTLGVATETEDAHGAIIEQTDLLTPICDERIDRVMTTMEGIIVQIPPMYSAVKVNGKRLYEYARDGIKVKRPQRKVHIKSFKRLEPSQYNAQSKTQTWPFVVSCGKGTYVRTLAVDVGAKLGYPAHMSSLTRLATGGYTIDQAVTLEQLTELVEQNLVEQVIRSMDSIRQILPWITIDDNQLFAIRHGQVVEDDFFAKPITEPTAIFYSDELLAIYQPHPTKEGKLKPAKVFPEEKDGLK